MYSHRDDIPKFEYLSQCLKESLRVAPPVPFIGRTTTKDLKLSDGRVIPKGEGNYIVTDVIDCTYIVFTFCGIQPPGDRIGWRTRDQKVLGLNPPDTAQNLIRLKLR